VWTQARGEPILSIADATAERSRCNRIAFPRRSSASYARDLIAVRPLAKYPLVSQRIWGVGTQFGGIGYSDDNGDTFVGATPDPSPTASAGIQQLAFSPTFAWLVTSVARDRRRSRR
jgi:hypothetical protein